MDDVFDLGYKDGEDWNDRTERLGLALGYPKCCIDAFINEDAYKRPYRKLQGTGYVPCGECNNKIEEELISVINRNRIGDTKFPNEPWGDAFTVISVCLE